MTSQIEFDQYLSKYGKEREITELIKTQRDHPEFISIYNGHSWVFYRQKRSSCYLFIERIRHAIGSVFKKYNHSTANSLKKLMRSKQLFEESQQEQVSEQVVQLFDKKLRYEGEQVLNLHANDREQNNLTKIKDDLARLDRSPIALLKKELDSLTEEQKLLNSHEPTLILLEYDEQKLEKFKKKKADATLEFETDLAKLVNYTENHGDYVSIDITLSAEKTQELKKAYKLKIDQLDEEISAFKFPLRKNLPDSLQKNSALTHLARLAKLAKEISDLNAEYEKKLEKFSEEKASIENSISLYGKNCEDLISKKNEIENRLSEINTSIKTELESINTFLPNSLEKVIELVESSPFFRVHCYRTLKMKITYLASLKLPPHDYSIEIGNQLIDPKCQDLDYITINKTSKKAKPMPKVNKKN